MRNMAIQDIFNYWNDLRGTRPTPLRSEIDPVALRRFLPHLFIISAAAEETPSFALAGTRICEIFDRELRGRDFASIWLDPEDKRPAAVFNNVLFYERPALVDVGSSSRGEDYPHDLLLMPIRSYGQRSDRVLGALIPRQGALPPLSLPIPGLALESWGFIQPDGTRPTISSDADISTSVPVTFFRRLVGARHAQPGR
jgi:hypothetical protein